MGMVGWECLLMMMNGCNLLPPCAAGALWAYGPPSDQTAALTDCATYFGVTFTSTSSVGFLQSSGDFACASIGLACSAIVDWECNTFTCSNGELSSSSIVICQQGKGMCIHKLNVPGLLVTGV